MAGRFDQTLDQLIRDQTKFITDVDPTKVVSAPVPLSNRFQPNLDQGLDTGFRADTSQARQTATQASDLTLRDTLARIAEQSAAKGLTGSSAQSQQGITAGVDLATLLGDRLAQLELGADENAANRRIQSLDAALGQASVSNASRGLDISQAGQALASKTGQTGAGQDLIDALLRNNPEIAARAAPPVRSNSLAGVQQPLARNTLAAPASTKRNIFQDFFDRRSGIGAGIAPAISGFDINANTAKINAQNASRNSLLASIFGQGGGAGVAAAGIGAASNLLGR